MRSDSARKRVLIIEDDRAMGELLCELFRKRQVEARAAASVLSAVQLLEKENFDLVLLDFGLPDFAGDDAIDLILSVRPGQKIVVLTGLFIEAELEARLRDKGAVAVLEKTMGFRNMFETVQPFLT